MGERSITGSDMIRDTSEKVDLIRKRLLMAQRRQMGSTSHGKRGKLAPRYIGPFEVLERVGTIAYRLTISPSLSGVHKVFHVSMLQKYTPDPAHVMDWGEITIDTYGTVKEGPMRILDSRDKVMRRKTMRLVKVLW